MPTSEEQQVLLLLAKEWVHSGPPGILDIKRYCRSPGSSPQCDIAGARDTFPIWPGRYEYP